MIAELLALSEATHGFTVPTDEIWQDNRKSMLLLAGKHYDTDPLPSPSDRVNMWQARSAQPFSIEHAATTPLYVDLRRFTDRLIDYTYESTETFSTVTAAWIHDNPQCLPVLCHIAGVFSKQELKKTVGSVSDNSISRPASERLADLVTSAVSARVPDPAAVKERIKATTEGIVRDLVGRLLLEEFVADALLRAGVPFQREDEYSSLEGVVYDFRADFVCPDPVSPRAFIEVRKSSSRHASLYAKDKMFSAINWKGRHPRMLAVIVVDGDWTSTTLEVMARVFDYVVPISQAPMMAETIRQYIAGDHSKLRWLIQFRIDAPETP
jgi:hypothetical protein